MVKNGNVVFAFIAGIVAYADRVGRENSQQVLVAKRGAGYCYRRRSKPLGLIGGATGRLVLPAG